MTNHMDWEKRIRRAEQLLDRNPSSSQVLAFYQQLVALQQDMSYKLASHTPVEAGRDASLIEQLDVDVAMHWLPALLEIVQAQGPAKLAEEARKISAVDEAEKRHLLLAYFDSHQPGAYSPSTFFARVLFQTQAAILASRLTLPSVYSESSCPFCGSQPQFAVLRPEGDGGKRHLACSLCLTEWEFRRILCPVCAEMDPLKLPRYSPEEPIAVRVDACDTCKAYLKSFDLTVDGLMVPEADEIATVALDVWAADNGYHKIQLNLLGF